MADTPPIDALQAHARAMSRDPRFKDVTFTKSKPISKIDAEMIGFAPLPPALVELYREADGISFGWRIADESVGFTCGEVRPRPATKSFFYNWEGRLWFRDLASGGDGERFHALAKTMIGFDLSDFTDGRTGGVFSCDVAAARASALAAAKATVAAERKKAKTQADKAGAPLPELKGKAKTQADLAAWKDAIQKQPPLALQTWFWHTAGNKYPLALDLEAYLARAVEVRGIHGWQRFFADLDALDFDDPMTRQWIVSVPPTLDVEHLRGLLHWMERLFPDIDREPYAQRLARFEARAIELEARHRPWHAG